MTATLRDDGLPDGENDVLFSRSRHLMDPAPPSATAALTDMSNIVGLVLGRIRSGLVRYLEQHL